MIDIVIPFWNNIEMTRNCVQSILDTTQGVCYRLILVDDGSTENTKEFFEWCAKRNNIITACFEHRGYVHTVNDGLRMATGEFVMILNNDTIISDPKWLVKMVARFDSKTGAVGPTSNFVSGFQHARYNDGRKEESTNILIGFCLMIKKSVLDEVGLCDPLFNDFAADDIDLSIRIAEKGYRLKIARDVFITHLGEMSQRNKPEWKQDRNAYYQRGMKQLTDKHGNEKVQKFLTEKARLMVSIPTVNGINGRFLANSWAWERPIGTVLFVPERTIIHLARNMVVQEFLQREIDYLLFVDDDMLLPPSAIKRLLAHDKDIVCAMAFRRKEPFQPCAFTFNKETKHYNPVEPRQGLIKVHGAGSACILIKRRVFEKLTDPWYEYRDIFGTENQIYNWGEYGEDLMFCRKAIEAGFEVWCDTDLIVGHIGFSPVIDDKTYYEYKAKEEAKKNETEVIHKER